MKVMQPSRISTGYHLAAALCLALLATLTVLSGQSRALRFDQMQVTASGTAESNGRVAFVGRDLVNRSHDPHIYTANPDGSGVTKLTGDPPLPGGVPVYYGSPTWSPDGSKIAFTSSRDGTLDIYTMNADGSGVTRLTNDPANEGELSWSPDSTRIVFTSYPMRQPGPLPSDGPNIYVMKADGSNITRLTSGATPTGNPTWSPDGSKIAFRSFRDGSTSNIYVMNADGSDQRKLIDTEGANDSEPAWSPDGAKIAFVVSRIAVASNAEIHVASANGSGATRLTDSATVNYKPVWSPDGTKIVFTRVTNFSFSGDGFAVSGIGPMLYTMNADGSDQKQLNVGLLMSDEPDWGPLTAAAQWEIAPSVSPEISTLVSRGTVYARVKLTFPDAGYRVADWGQVVRTGNDFTVDARVERWTGGSAQVITTIEHLYRLGQVAQGSYSFTFKSYGMLFKTQPFTVSAAPPPMNAIDDPAFFARQHYIDFLSREPETQGFNAWIMKLTECGRTGGGPQCLNDMRTEVSASFFRSEEFQFKGYFVYRFYKATLGRMPKYAEFVLDMGRVTGRTDAEVIARREAFAREWLERAEFRARYDGTTNAEFVDRLLEAAGIGSVTYPATGAAPTLSREALIEQLNNGGSRTEMVRSVVESAEVYQKEYNSAFVLMQYFGYLRRDPEDDGYQAWLRVLNRNPADYRTMVWGFVTSVEYRNRFGQP